MDFDPWDDDPEYLLDDDPAPPPLTLTPAERSELLAHLARALPDRECDESFRVTRRWALTSGASWSRLRQEFDAHGAFCDCQLLDLLAPGAGDGPFAAPCP